VAVAIKKKNMLKVGVLILSSLAMKPFPGFAECLTSHAQGASISQPF